VVSQYSLVKYVPCLEEYNNYYDIVVDICDIGVETFGARSQDMLVDYLCSTYGDEVADARGRMCLAQSLYGGCNNNMGVKVSWHNIKKLLVLLPWGRSSDVCATLSRQLSEWSTCKGSKMLVTRMLSFATL
jgi:hypothetical protein